MGAMISYLYKTRGIKNFFVVAPNLTIYEKLKADFTYGTPKYVFPGISDFDGSNPVVIDGDNYQQLWWLFTEHHKDKVIINVFNISKFNSTKETTKMKKLSEYLGQSYFEYLQSLDDLVVLMDESHRYKADKSISALNDLHPVLWLEFTATPYINEWTAKPVRASNILYEYSLAAALRDSFVKRPCVATRKNLAEQTNQDQLDMIKITDGIYLHEDTKVALECYAKNNNVPIVKPFIMINASDQHHADDIEKMIKSDSFFEGKYKDKVLKIYSSLGGSDKDWAVKMLLEVEKPSNPIEIVIQVAMLKEWRDVNNLYTIVPLRAFAADILTEQTLGRWLRLPYGKLTGDEKVDRLTIVAHDRFQKLIDEANKPDSLIRNVIDLDQVADLKIQKIVMQTTGQFDTTQEMMQRQAIQQQIKESWLTQEQAQAGIELTNKAQQEVIFQIQKEEPKKINDQAYIAQKTQEKLLSWPYHSEVKLVFGQLSPERQKKYIATVSTDLSSQFVSRSIDIPRVTFDYPDLRVEFDTSYNLDTQLFKQLLVTDAPIIIRDLLSWQETDSIHRQLINPYPWTVEECLVNMILDVSISELDYDIYNEWLFKLAWQAVQTMKESYPNESENMLKNIITLQYKEPIYQEIARQIRSVKKYIHGDAKITVSEWAKIIRTENLEMIAHNGLQDYRTYNQPAIMIGQYVFTWFTKGIARQCKFQANKERIFACILENQADTKIKKRLKPPLDTFDIYYFDEEHKQHKYNPDFIVETDDTVYMIETKAANMMDDLMVRAKQEAAKKRIDEVNKSGLFKHWEYVIISDDQIDESKTFEYMVSVGRK